MSTQESNARATRRLTRSGQPAIRALPSSGRELPVHKGKSLVQQVSTLTNKFVSSVAHNTLHFCILVSAADCDLILTPTSP